MKRIGNSRGKPQGFTVMELATVVSILGILAMIAIPGMLGAIQRSGVDGASRRLAGDIRYAQSSALARGAQTRLIAFNQSGTAANPGASPLSDAAKANRYRIELRSGASAPWPALTDMPGTNGNVLTVWHDLAGEYRGVAVASGNALVFNSQGFLANSAAPLAIALQGPGGARTIQTSAIGKVAIQ